MGSWAVRPKDREKPGAASRVIDSISITALDLGPPERFDEKSAHLHVLPVSHRMPLKDTDYTIIAVYFALRSPASTLKLSLPPGYKILEKGERGDCKALAPETVAMKLDRDQVRAWDLPPHIKSCSLSAAPPTPKAMYQRKNFGDNGCPEGTEITTEEECEKAILSLGYAAKPSIVDESKNIPRWCSMRSHLCTSTQCQHFNPGQVGAGRADLAPICRIGEKATQHTEEGANDVGDKAQITLHLASNVADLSALKLPTIRLTDGTEAPRLQFFAFRVFVRNPTRTPADDYNLFELHWTPEFHLNGVPPAWDGAVQAKADPILGNWGCKYSNWEGWGSCSARCGGGVQLVTRRVLLKPPPDQVIGTNPCDEPLTKEADCNQHRCTFPCSFEATELIGECSAVCGGGRRAVRHRWSGDGCPHVSDTDAISWIPCNTQPCIVPCQMGRERALTECPMQCGPGKVITFKEIKSKDPSDHTCNVQFREVPCERMNCEPGGLTIMHPEKTIVPMAGDWYVVGVLFSIGQSASHVWIAAPDGYSFGDSRNSSCGIDSHNLGEEWKSCEVMERTSTIKLSFADILDPVKTQTHDRNSLDGSYSINIFVKNPECNTGWKKRTDGGSLICVGETDTNQWHLEYADASPGRRHHEIVSKGYDLHRMDAKPIRMDPKADEKFEETKAEEKFEEKEEPILMDAKQPISKGAGEKFEEEFEGMDPWVDMVTSEPYLQGSYCTRRKKCDDGLQCNFDLGICSSKDIKDYFTRLQQG